MKFEELTIKGLYKINNFSARDSRGIFIKTFHEAEFEVIGFSGKFAESYYSQSSKNVIRGMHFQTPPYQHEKLVYVTEGNILDVVVDLRTSSPTYGKYCVVELEAFASSVFIPKGCAHGFLTLSTTATVVYNVTTMYKNESDSGIKWDSFGFDWMGLKNPIMSIRDQSFVLFNDFNSPF